MRQNIPFSNSYATLPEKFYSRVLPTHVKTPKLIKLNLPLAHELGLDEDWLSSNEGVAMLAGNFVPEGADPLACVYAGHQFGHFTPQLGDGRAILLGEITGKTGRRDIQLKGSGLTPYSRRGDGRAALGPVLREYIISEAMFALGIPTTRTLACVKTGEGVVRDNILPGAVLTRIASSHIRIGTFQYFAAKGDYEAVKILADYAIARHYPDTADAQNPYAALLTNVILRQAELIAKWQNIGFVHGVMNTDNMSISGETIDYGPCAFMHIYDPSTVFSSIDSYGRYSYGNQPRIAQWNLTKFAEALLPLLGTNEDESIGIAQSAIDTFPVIFEKSYFDGLRSKLGLFSEQERDKQFINSLLVLLAEKKQDFTNFFHMLSISDTHIDDSDLQNWVKLLSKRSNQELSNQDERIALMKRSNPVYIPRNHLVEDVIVAAMERDDYAPFEELIKVLSLPYYEQQGCEKYALPQKIWAGRYFTFCGT